MKTAILLCAALLPLAASAQKLQATAPPRTYHVGNEKAPLYASAADTAGKPRFTVPPGWEISVVGEFSPRWAIVKREGYLYLTPIQKLNGYNSSTVPTTSEKRLNYLMAQSQRRNDAWKRRTDSLLAQSRKMSDSLIALSQKISEAKKVGLKNLDDKNGFRSYHFGDNISSHSHLKLVEGKDGRKRYYTNPNDNLKIGDASLKDISYGFYKGKLSFILIQTKGIINSHSVKATLEAQYGSGYRSNELIEEYFWFGDKVTLVYDEKPISGDANIIFKSKALTEQEAADDKEAAKRATSDL